MVGAVKGWSWPLRSAKTELGSLKFQASRFRVGVMPESAKIRAATERVLREYPHVPPLPVFCEVGGKVVLSRGAFDFFWPSLLSDVSKDSSPGMPFMALGCVDNASVLAKHPEQLKEAVWERLMLHAFGKGEGQNAVNLVLGGYTDPVRVFVKNEPHPEIKIKQGRLRLISSVSLVDQLVERVLMTQQNKAEIENWHKIPSKPGLGLDDDGLRRIWEYVKPWTGVKFEADISGWDFGLQLWEMLWEADVRAELAGMVGTIYHKALRSRVWCEANTLFMLSNGSLIAQTKPGKRCSGSYNTSAGNSRCRVGLGYIVGSTQIMAMGDDSVEEGVAGAREQYEAMGHIVKLFAESKDGFEFCSTRIFEREGQVVGEPVNWSRTFFRLLHACEGFDERLSQFKFEMRHSPYLEPCLLVLKRIGWGSSKHVKEDEENGTTA